MIDAAVDQYAIENNKSGGSAVNWTDIRNYLKAGSRLETSGGADILGNNFTINVVDTVPQVNSSTFNALSTVAPASFWSPFN